MASAKIPGRQACSMRAYRDIVIDAADHSAATGGRLAFASFAVSGEPLFAWRLMRSCVIAPKGTRDFLRRRSANSDPFA